MQFCRPTPTAPAHTRHRPDHRRHHPERDRGHHSLPSADKLCAWAGLTPKEHSSADNVRRGHISKQGSRWLRWVMVEAAVHAFRDVELRQLFVRIARRRGAKVARVAVARRLLTLVYYALRSESGCRSYPIASNPKVEARSMAVMASN